MTWAGGQCLHCQKRIPQRQKQAEFCSSDCALAYRKKDSAERHGVVPRANSEVPASVRAVAKSLAVTQRIRVHVDANAERRRILPPASQTAVLEPPVANQLALERPGTHSIPLSKVSFDGTWEIQGDLRLPERSFTYENCNPATATDLKPLGAPPRRPAPLSLR